MSANPDDKTMPLDVRVKALEFVGDGDGVWKASALTGLYWIVRRPGDLYQLRMSWSLMLYDAQCRSLDEAKAAAQADYTARILSALEPSPSAERMREALTPSGETKAAYIGEFTFTIDSDGDSARRVTVPWTTIKEIMAAIRTRALTNHSTQGDGK